VPVRPVGPATARVQHANDVRRRHYSATPDIATDGIPGGRSGTVAPTTSAAMAAAVAADLYGNNPPARVTGASHSRVPVSAWTSSRPSAPAHSGGARSSSASPQLTLAPGVSTHSGPPAHGYHDAPLSAREARDEVMRTCRGNFNVSCTSSRAPKQIMQEMHRALALQRVTYEQTSSFLVKCQRQGIRFDMEVSHLDHLESVYVVRFRRVAGDLVNYKELCSKILAEMKI